MNMATPPNDRKAIVLVSSLGAFVGGLCCLTPIAVVLFGLAGISVANDLGNTLYGDYKWHFRVAALVFLTAGLVVYFRRRGVCSLDEARRQRNRILNVALLSLFTCGSVYVFWNYVALHYWGIAAGLPWAQWDESWAIPTSVILLAGAAAALLYWKK